jgi:hypothetical protein
LTSLASFFGLATFLPAVRVAGVAAVSVASAWFPADQIFVKGFLKAMEWFVCD